MAEQLLFRRSPDVVAANLGEKSFLLHVGQWVYLELNESGSRIWDLLEDGTTPSALVDHLTREFDVDRNVCEQQTEEFLAELALKQFVLSSAATSGAE